MSSALTPGQLQARREALRALAVLISLEVTGKNTDDPPGEERMPDSIGEAGGPTEAANLPFPAPRSGRRPER
jgi:hypothetical protein